MSKIANRYVKTGSTQDNTAATASEVIQQADAVRAEVRDTRSIYCEPLRLIAILRFGFPADLSCSILVGGALSGCDTAKKGCFSS